MVAAQVGGSPGTVSGLHLVVTDIEAAHAELRRAGRAGRANRFHFAGGSMAS